ncbi:hypothetical protein [Sorangium sp. So ce381]|uniref:hypothetical protein n=1 Tax=Sorangium sp. So ce381 TaxID=3133307 RepID=UPI003F5C3F78
MATRPRYPWTVDALDTSTTPATVLRSAAIEIGFSRQDVKGAIFYWSTTSAGVRRGKIPRRTPENHIVGKPPTTYSDGDKVKCVACRVVSRDGKYMAAPVSADSGNSLWILGVTTSGGSGSPSAPSAPNPEATGNS